MGRGWQKAGRGGSGSEDCLPEIAEPWFKLFSDFGFRPSFGYRPSVFGFPRRAAFWETRLPNPPGVAIFRPSNTRPFAAFENTRRHNRSQRLALRPAPVGQPRSGAAPHT